MLHDHAALAAWTDSHRVLGLDWSMLSAFGLIGNAFFSSRFLVQWIVSERQGESVIPISFWYLSIAGSIVLLIYFTLRHDPVGTLAYLPNCFVYVRNLRLIRRRNRLALAPG
jgi:lipid-A-disaccharide synthase-like uncharacterized protein